MEVFWLLVGTGVYIALGRTIVGMAPGTTRDALFALLNMAGVYALFFPLGPVGPALIFACYIVLAVVQHYVLRVWGVTVAAFIVPIAALIAIKGVLALDPSWTLPVLDRPIVPMLAALIGVSYFAFRCSYLALEVRNGVVAMPTLWQYLGFCFFAPTMAVGPISRYSVFRTSLEKRAGGRREQASQAALRLLVGAVKYRFLAGILDQLTYAGLMLDGHPHHWIDLGVAAVAYYLFLYCNFSGFCDMAIGAAGLMGVAIEENFNNPFAARNLRDFWNRWHITLSTYMRDVVFLPVSSFMARRLGPANTNHAVAGAIIVVFLLIGLWHGLAWHFVAFGAMHAIGVVTAHYYTVLLKRRLGRQRFAAYNSDALIRIIAVVVTFAFVTSSFFLFANEVSDMRTILSSVRWS
jgi:D-alanyl-lipoteichoic acid acyltransferase DltB (MBOAT superfamily)